MKVRELIEKLQEANSEAEVIIDNEQYRHHPLSVCGIERINFDTVVLKVEY